MELYEVGGYAHKSYLEKAHKVMRTLPDMPVESILRVAGALK